MKPCLPAGAALWLLASLAQGQAESALPNLPNRVFRIGTELDYPPYSYLDEQGLPAGFNIVLTRAIAEVMGLQVEIRIGPWGEVRQALETGQIDAIVGMYRSAERDKLVDFSPPFTVVHHAVFARPDSPPIEKEEDLRGRRIIVMQGDIMHDYVREHGITDDILTAPTQADALRQLASGKGDCMLCAKLPGIYWVRDLGLANLAPVGPILRPSEYCFAVQEGNQALLARLTEGLAILDRSGRYRQIYDETLGPLEPRSEWASKVLFYGSILVGTLALLFLVAAGWSLSLRREVARRTAELVAENAARRVAEEELRRLNATLEQEVRRRTAESERRAVELARSNADLEQFAYVASHDLQEPLRMVASFCQLLGSHYTDTFDERGARWLEFAVGGAQRMQRLVEDLLAYARVARGKPLQPASSQEAFEQVIGNLARAIDESGAVVTRGDLPSVTADPAQLVQLFQNLVGNAIKYRGTEPPQVHVQATRGADSEWQFCVRDNGIGIDSQHHERIFQMFKRLHTSDEYSGTGIGLALCKRIVERHDGRIWVESRLGEGSAFYFTIPDHGDQR